MLQKLLVILVGLVMSLVGALSPAGMFASEPSKGPGFADDLKVVEETLATVRTGDGQAFARVNVLWVEVDGRRVTEDAWGTGEVKELRFKVGVKDAGKTALAVGDKILDLHPTDTLTIRLFRGDFSIRGVDTTQTTLQLQGTVKTTLLSQGDVTNRLRTEAGGFDLDAGKGARASGSAEDAARVAFVVLDTGERVDTVAVDDGGARLFTKDVAVAAQAEGQIGNMLAKWVKLDGKVVREYTWGDGSVDRIEFEPADAGATGVELTFNGATVDTAAGTRVVIRDFVGEYLVYQVPGGLLRIRLDGYAADFRNGPDVELPVHLGDGAPVADFSISPPQPDTTDHVQFKDLSYDEDGVIVFRMWDFGDNTSSVLPEPTHRFKVPGVYEVKLTVRDNDLRAANTTLLVHVANALPVPDFDFSPKVVNTDTIVSFKDLSYDPDGEVRSHLWSFGDGTTSTDRHPTHQFPRGGNFSVTLTVTDDLGGTQSLSKVVIVRNAPPLAAFDYEPQFPRTLEPVQFLDNSSDRDGRVVNWTWNFGDGTVGWGANPNYAYQAPGLYTVSLTVTDDAGDSHTWGRHVAVANRAPVVDFTWAPDPPTAKEPVAFTSLAYDPDGEILLQRWSWGDGSAANLGPAATHVFHRAGEYEVSLTVTDSSLQSTTFSRTVTVNNSAPRAGMVVNPSPAYRDVEVTFVDTSYDTDGDAIVSRFWEFGDGSSSTEQVAKHRYSATGTFEVSLTVTDEHGKSAIAKQTIRVVNRPPIVSATVWPEFPTAGVPVYLNASARDLDNSSGDITFEWTLHTGEIVTQQNLVVTFERNGNYTLKLVGIDGDGGRSPALGVLVRVDHAPPVALFSFDPVPAATRGAVNFTDLSTSPNGAIVARTWYFGDGDTSSSANPSHVYDEHGMKLVTLEVADVLGQNDTYQEWIYVNARPVANFNVPAGTLPLKVDVQFEDTSTDADGTIRAWHWDFGDGYTSSAEDPKHAFQLPGRYAVSLTVTDNNGTADTIVKRVDVANRAPVARFYVDPTSTLRVESPVRFVSSDTTHPDHSYDPDGQTLVGWKWDFGDRSDGSTEKDPYHKFAASGLYRVQLVVNDGELDSVPDAGASKLVRIGADHALTLTVRGALPDGRSALLTTDDYDLSLQVGTPTLGFRTYDKIRFVENRSVPDQISYDLTLPAGDWMKDEVATIRIRHTGFMQVALETSVVLKDAHGLSLPAPYMTVQIPMPLVPEVEPSPGDKPSLLLTLLNEDNYTSDNVPVYTRMDEHFHGTGVVHWLDGQPASLVSIELEARYVPIRAVLPFDAIRESVPDQQVTGWCRATTATTGTDGTYSWRFSGAGCLSTTPESGLYPVGRWEVRAIAAKSYATTGVSEVAPIYVDPTGGTLISLTGTLV